jgi:MFS family permease
MIDISKSSPLKYLLFGSLYFMEGLNKAYVIVLPVYFLDINLPPEIITLIMGIAAVPMIIKFVWGGIVDYYISKGRKIFVFLGGLLSSISLFILVIIDPSVAIVPFTIFMLIGWIGVAFLDVSADAWAIEISSEDERGKINGAMFAGQNIGLTFGAILLPFVALTYGYTFIFLTGGIIVLLIILFPLFVKENIKVKKPVKMVKLLTYEFKKKTTQLISIFAPFAYMSCGILFFIVPIYLDISLSLDVTQIGYISAIFTFAIAFGSLSGGVISDRIGRKKTLYIMLSGSLLSTASLIFTNNWLNFTITYSIIGLFHGGLSAAALAMLMDITNPKIGATQFSILTGIGNFGYIFAGAISGSLYVMLGFSKVFLYSAWIFGPALILLHFIRLKKFKKSAIKS